jgi:hypothetical protein
MTTYGADTWTKRANLCNITTTVLVGWNDQGRVEIHCWVLTVSLEESASTEKHVVELISTSVSTI